MARWCLHGEYGMHCNKPQREWETRTHMLVARLPCYARLALTRRNTLLVCQ